MSQTGSAEQRPALVTAARDHYLNVVYGKTNAGQPTEPFWLKEAGLAAARLAEAERDWEVASQLYARLADLLPPMRASLERRRERVQERLRQTPN
jgi:hypothetical protein